MFIRKLMRKKEGNRKKKYITKKGHIQELDIAVGYLLVDFCGVGCADIRETYFVMMTLDD